MSTLIKTGFTTKEGDLGSIITRRRITGGYVTTFEPKFGLDFFSMDANKTNSHEIVKNFLRDIKGCRIDGDPKIAIPRIKPRRFIP
jgi:hypothetical protein